MILRLPAHALSRFLFRRNDREQNIGLALRPGVQRYVASEDGRGPVARVIMAERPYTGPLLTEGLRARGRFSTIDVVFAANGEPDTVTSRHDDTGRPNLDIDLVSFARCEFLDLIVGMIRPIRQRELLVELAMRGAQPSLGNGRMRVERPVKGYFLHVRRKHAHHHEQVSVLGRRGDP